MLTCRLCPLGFQLLGKERRRCEAVAFTFLGTEEPARLSLRGPAVLGRVQGRALVFTGCGLEQGSDFSGSLFPLQEALSLRTLPTLMPSGCQRA